MGRAFNQIGLNAGLLLVVLTAPNLAHAGDVTFVAPHIQSVDALGIEMNSDQYVRHDVLLSIGGVFSWAPPTHSTQHWATDFVGYIGSTSSQVDGSYYLTVHTGEKATYFSSSYANLSGNSATLSASGSNYTFTDVDGTVYTFIPVSGTSGTVMTSVPGISTILRPDGSKLTYSYFSASNCDVACIASIVSNQGYGLKFDETNNQVQVVNMLAHGCDAAALSCDTYDATVNISYPTDSTGTWNAYTDPSGNIWKYIIRATYQHAGIDPTTGEPTDGPRPPGIKYFQDPTGFSVSIVRNDYVKYATGPFGCITSFTDPRGTFSRTRDNSTTSLIVKDPSGTLIYTADEGGLASPYSSNACNSGQEATWIRDPLNRQTNYSLAGYGSGPSGDVANYFGGQDRIVGITHPEGDSVSYGYDSRDNLTSVTHTGKSGSGLTAVMTASYPTTCTNAKTCNKPTWTKDAKGNETDYTYDGTHGGVLTVTLPADQNGLRQRTYNTYTAFDTGNGLIYRLTRTETCGLSSSQLSLTACPAASSTSVTTTDYGNASTAPYTYKSFQPYAVTQTDGAGSVSATTTYGYDVIGNVVVVDGPRTDVDDRSYKTYDAMRRVIYEIGVLPGGSGSPHRTVIHHVYDGAGRELRTETGYASSDATNGSDFVVTSFKRTTYDAAGRLVKTELVQP